MASACDVCVGCQDDQLICFRELIRRSALREEAQLVDHVCFATISRSPEQSGSSISGLKYLWPRERTSSKWIRHGVLLLLPPPLPAPSPPWPYPDRQVYVIWR